MAIEKVDLSRLPDKKVLIIFDLDSVARTEFLSLHSENFLGRELKAVKIKGDLYNTSILYGVLEHMVKRPFYKTDYLFTSDTRDGFLSWLYQRFEQGGLPDLKQEFYSQLSWLRYLIKKMDYNLMEKDGYEGYNFIYQAVKDNYDEYDKIFIFSEDKVLYPLVDSRVSVLTTQQLVSDLTVSTYEDILNVPYNLIQLKQCTVGDASLGIKGAFRFGEKSFEKMVLKDEIFDKPNTSTEDLIKESVYLKDSQKFQAINALEWLQPRDVSDVDTKPRKANIIDVKSLLDKLEFTDLLEKAENLEVSGGGSFNW